MNHSSRNGARLVVAGIVCGLIGFQIASREWFVARRAHLTKNE